jgi:hypothetical protein
MGRMPHTLFLRIQEFKPASGKVKLNKAVNAVTSFIEGVFNTWMVLTKI